MSLRWLSRMHARRIGPGALGLVVATVACVAAVPAGPDDRFVRSDTPVFPAPEKGRALVFLLRPIWVMGTLPALELYDETGIWGYLPVRSYIAVQLEPGERVFPDTGPGTGFELFLTAGRTYALRLDESRDAAGKLQSKWAEMKVADLPMVVAGKKLKYATLTDRGREALEKARAELAATRGRPGAP